MAISVPIAIIRLVPLTRCSSWSGGSVGAGGRRRGRPDRRHLLRPLLAVLPIRTQVAAQRRRLQVGERLDRWRRRRGRCGPRRRHGRRPPRARCSRGARRRRRRADRVPRRRRRTRSRRCRPGVPSTTTCVQLRRPCATRASCSAPTCFQRSSSIASVTAAASIVARATCPSSGREAISAVPGPAVPATTTGGTCTLGALGEQERVGLGLDVLEPGGVERRAAVLVRERAPELRHELRVGLVAPEHPHREVAVVVGRSHRGAGDRVGAGSRCTSWASTPSSTRVACTCAAVGRPPGEPNARCTRAAIAHPSATAASSAVGQRGAEVHRCDRDEEHEQLTRVGAPAG